MSSNTLGPVDIEFFLKNLNIKEESQRIRNDIKGISNTANETNKVLSTLGAGFAAYLSFEGIKGLGGDLINVRGQFQQLGIALETILGSKGKADALMSQIVDLAAKTPFTLAEVGQGAKQLLAFQVSQDEVIDTLTRLGNVASGVSVPIDRLILAYGQVKAKGKLMGDDLRQFTEAGIPMIHELAKVMGVADSAISKMVESGQIGFSDVQKVIKNLTNEGGMFFNLMEKQSKSLTGMVSNLGDAWARMLNDIGTNNEGILAGGINGLTNLVNNYQRVIDITKLLVATYGTYKTATILSTIATNGMTIAENLHYAALVIAEKAQKLLNTTTLANPYIAVATALTAVIGGLIIYSKWTKEASEGQKRITEANKKAGESFAEEKGKIDLLLSSARNQALTDKQRLEAINKIKEVIPGYNAELSKEGKLINENTTALQSYLTQLELKIKMTAVQDELADLWRKEREQIKLVEEAEKNLAATRKLNTQGTGIISGGDIGIAGAVSGFDSINAASRDVDKEKNRLSEIKKALEDLKNEYSKSEKDLADFLNVAPADVKVRSVEVIDAEIKSLKELQSKLSDTAQKWDDYDKKISTLEREKTAITGDKKKDKSDLKDRKKDIEEYQKELDELLERTATYSEKRRKLTEKYTIERQDLAITGDSGNIAELDRQYKEDLNALESANFKKDTSYRWLYDNISKMGRKSLQDYIDKLKREVDAFKGNEEIKLELTKKLAEAEEKLNTFVPDKLKDGAGVLQEMSSLAGEFNKELADILSNIAGLANGLSTAMAGFSTGNVLQGIGGVVSIITSAVKLIDGKDQNQTANLEKWIAKLVKVIQLQENSLSILSSKDQINAYTALLETVTNQLDAIANKSEEVWNKLQIAAKAIPGVFKEISETLKKNFNDLTQEDWNTLLSSDFYNGYKDQLTDLYNEWIELQKKQQEYINSQNELLTGSTYDSIVSSIVDGFSNGLDSAADFADSFEELMRKALLQSLQVQYLEKPLQDWYNQFAAANQNGLTEEEIAALKAAYNSIITNAEDYAKSLETATGLTLDKKDANGTNSINTLSGAIQGMSQESADLLAGQFGAIRIHVADIAAAVTGKFNENLKDAFNTEGLSNTFGLGLTSINASIIQSNEYLYKIEANTRLLSDIKQILEKPQNNRGYKDSFLEDRIGGRL